MSFKSAIGDFCLATDGNLWVNFANLPWFEHQHYLVPTNSCEGLLLDL